MFKKVKDFVDNFNQHYVVEDLIDTPNHPELIVLNDPASYLSQQYIQLAGALLHHQDLKRMRSMLITSPQPGDGKTTTISNIAVALANHYQKRILLVDSDWRRPQLTQMFRLRDYEHEYSDELQGKIKRSDLENLFILPVDKEHENWLEFLLEFHDELVSEYDLVLFDCAPVLKVNDAVILGRSVDAVIMAVRAQDTPATMIEEAEDVLNINDCPSKASILVNHPNSVDIYNYLLNPHYRRYYNNYYGDYSKESGKLREE